MPETKVLSKRFDIPGLNKVEAYRQHGGYEILEKVLKERIDPDQIVQTVKDSGLRGRGGAGFPCGLKWTFLDKDLSKPRYLVCNADEGEPGTFKDRYILERDPHSLIEGMILASYAIRAHKAYIYLRAEFVEPMKFTQSAINDAYANGLLGRNILGSGYDLDLYIHPGAGAYICGEETSLLDSLEGRRGYPRIKPPFPAVEGLFRSPTIVNNVETLASVTFIVGNGVEWYKSLGTEKSPGTKLFAISGHVKKPGVYEYKLGTTLRELIFEAAGGMIDDKKFKATQPGGSSCQYLVEEHLDISMDFESLAEAGTMLGSGAVIVYAEGTDMVEVTKELVSFYKHESCGQCTPCREGCHWLYQIIKKIYDGEGTMEDLEMLPGICDNMDLGNTICVLANAAIAPVQSALKYFFDEFKAKIK